MVASSPTSQRKTRPSGLLFRCTILVLAVAYAAVLALQFHKSSVAIPDSTIEGLLSNFHFEYNPPAGWARKAAAQNINGDSRMANENEPYPMSSKQLEWFDENRYDLYESENAQATGSIIWDRPSHSTLPSWLKAYFEWHRKKISLLDDENWYKSKFLVMRCLKGESCGGAADRLLPIPTILKICANHQRILLIYWETPSQIEDFLLPPIGGMDWRIPSFLLNNLIPNNERRGDRQATVPSSQIAFLDQLDHIIDHAASKEIVVRVSHQSSTHGSEYFDDHSISPSANSDISFDDAFSMIWSALFTPAAPIATQVEDTLKRLQLVPRRYTSAHLRALDAAATHDGRTIDNLTRNALNCASRLRQNDEEPILFVSDASQTLSVATRYGHEQATRIVVSNSTSLHLDEDARAGSSPRGFESLFVDVYMLSLGRCVARSSGGFGRWASLISYSRCNLEYMTADKTTACEWDGSKRHGIVEDKVPQFFFRRPVDRSPRKSDIAADASAEVSTEAVSPPESMPANLTKLQVILDKIYLETGRQATEDIWEHSIIIPKWMKDYFHWHKQQRASLTQENWMNHQYLVMQCLAGKDQNCGGTADRLKGFLTLLRVAKEQNRLLFIHWTSPAKLDEFLQPPKGGFDWRLPSWFADMFEEQDDHPMKKLTFISSSSRNANTKILRTRFQSITGGMEYYNEQLEQGEIRFNRVYHDAWRIFFTPNPKVAVLIEKEMKSMRLVPGDYSAAHFRAFYARVAKREESDTIDITQNGINCSTYLNPGHPVYFASDYSVATEKAIEYGKKLGRKVVARKHESAPLHLDRATDKESRHASEFYETFIDLYLLGMSTCVTYNRGGFGHWGRLLSYNSTCYLNQKTSQFGPKIRCNWTDATKVEPSKKSEVPLFLPPISYPDDEIDAGLVSEKTNFEPERGIVKSSEFPSIPNWMNEYFEWHSEQRQDMSPSNWQNKKFLVMTCDAITHHCGGISDRLRPLPFIVLSAHRAKRILLIYWQRPGRLENYFVPPKDGLDWVVPKWFEAHLVDNHVSPCLTVVDALKKLKQNADRAVIRTVIQSSTSGADYYEEQLDVEGSTYLTVFHGLFRKMFVPSDRLSVKVDSIMKTFGLEPGKYAAAHLRAMYGNRKFRPPQDSIALTVNAINCASTLVPGGPVYFAADIAFGLFAAREYGRQRSLQVATLLDAYQMDNNGTFVDTADGDPIHLDKDYKWRTRDPSAYDDTFLDLYMMSQSRCVAYSNGGFGIFGQYISHDPHCSIRHFQLRKMLNYCEWQHTNGTFRRYTKPEINIPPSLLIDPTATKN